MSNQLKASLLGISRGELADKLSPLDKQAFRIKQLWHWIYCKGCTRFEEMTTLSKELRDQLAAKYTLQRPGILAEQLSCDGTRKWLLNTGDNLEIETVFIPEDDRGALCLSSQVGCTLNCTFCHTGTQRLVRNLKAEEIVGQLMIARDSYGEWKSSSTSRIVTNLVVMGMGEPLYNFDEISKALFIIMDPEGIAISKRRITLSTSGVVPMMKRVGEELGVGLAISLHAVSDELRNILVPINRKYPIHQLLEACRAYPGASNARRITFEYVMLDGINDSPSDAIELARLLKNIPAKVNLIPFNKWPGTIYKSSPPHKIKRFSQILNDHKLSAPIRVPRGRDIMAACGQLKSVSRRPQDPASTKKSVIGVI